MELVAEWLSDLRRNFTDEPLVSDARVGVFYTAVEISTGEVGASLSPSSERSAAETAGSSGRAKPMRSAPSWKS